MNCFQVGLPALLLPTTVPFRSSAVTWAWLTNVCRKREVELQGVNLERFGTLTRLSPSAMNSMLIRRCPSFPVERISRSDFQVCYTCTNETPGVSLRHWRYAWSTICNSCGLELLPVSTDSKDIIRLPPRLRSSALAGAGLPKQAYRHGNQRAGWI